MAWRTTAPTLTDLTQRQLLEAVSEWYVRHRGMRDEGRRMVIPHLGQLTYHLHQTQLQAACAADARTRCLWPLYRDGATWVLERGWDFTSLTENMQMSAARYGMRSRKLDRNMVAVQFVGDRNKAEGAV
jgi:hypothetical protein